MISYVEGLKGEDRIRNILINLGIHFFQADLLFSYQDKWYLGEIKHQEAFEPPPFRGHGLPNWQIDARLEFQKQFGIRAVLFIVEKKTDEIYYQFLDVLMAGEKYQTNGYSPRMIFPIKNYKRFKEVGFEL